MDDSTRNLWIGGAIAVVLIIVITIASFGGPGLFNSSMTIASSAFVDNGMIPAVYTCDGDGVSPPISFTNVPKNTRSIVLYIFDQDVPKGGYVHWVLYDIDPLTKKIDQGKIPTGSVEGLNSGNKVGYQPPCPPSGTHRYLFTAYAVSNTYHFVRTPTIDQLKRVMKDEVLGKATMTGKYTRTKT